MDALVARTGGAAPSLARRAAAGAHAASWPLRCRRAPPSASSASASLAAAATQTPTPTPRQRRQHTLLRLYAAATAAPTATPQAQPQKKQKKTKKRTTSTKPLHQPESTSALLLRALARHPPPRELVLLLAAAPPALMLAAAVFFLAPAGAASASEGAVALSGAGLELFEAFLDQVTALGIWGPVAFCATVMLCEMVPLFPTQPLALSSGLLFGAKWGALYQLIAVTLAASNAFLVARTVGRSLAERVIREELGHSAAAASMGSASSSMASATDSEGDDAETTTNDATTTATPAPSGLAAATRAIEEGGPFKQFTAVLLLRLTPVVPYSASNYLLGLTPLGIVPYLAGTVVGMLPWTVLYAGVGGASRRLLQRGVSVELLMQDLSERAARVSGDAAGVVAALVAAAAAAYALSQAFGRGAGGSAVTAAAAADAGGGGGGGGNNGNKAPAAATAAGPEPATTESNRR